MAEKQKLMLISPMLHQGGFERVCVTTARLLQEYYEITIVIFDSADIAFDIEGLNVIDIGLGVREGKVQKLINVFRRACKIKALKKEMKTDIAYSFGPTANLVNALSKAPKCKTWLGLRGFADLDNHYRNKFFSKCADLVICCSKEIEKIMKEKYHCERTATLHNPYNVEIIWEQAEKEEPKLPWPEVDEHGKPLRYLVGMGREDWIKGFWHLLKVFALVQKEIPEARLIIPGDGTFEKYKKLSRDLRIDDYVFFPGMQRNPYKYVKKAEIFLLSSWTEGFPNVLVEGMVMKKPVISTNCLSGPAEILTDEFLYDDINRIFNEQQLKNKKRLLFGDYGVLLPDMGKEENFDAEVLTREEKEFADAVLMMMRDDKCRQKYAELGYARAKEFSYESYVDNFMKL